MTLDDDRTIGRVLARREVLALFGTSAGAAVVAAYLPARGTRHWRGVFAPALANAAEPCVVRPEQTEGPYFVDERLNRADIRSDPGTGTVKAGTRLALAVVVQRLDGDSCVPLEGALVDVWHCDAAGVYSDVSDPGFNTVGQKFLRGYQLTDATGTASFVTIYPGWYQGRTVHIHFKVRTDPDSASGFEFTSQLYFDDALTDVVHAQQPYAAKGQRTLRNAGDGIYQDSGDELTLAPEADGAGGYAATFNIAVDLGGSTTTTTLPGASCVSTTACLADLTSALPDPATASSRKARRAARRLTHLASVVAMLLDRVATATARRRTRLYAKARARLQLLLTIAQSADAKGTLDVPLGPITAAVTALNRPETLVSGRIPNASV